MGAVEGSITTAPDNDHLMSDIDDPEHRAYHQPDPADVTLRESDDEDGTFSIRMPIASTGEVRNEGDEPLTRDELSGMAQQIEERPVSVFLDHGQSELGGGGGMFGNRYSAIGKVGEWANPELVDERDSDEPATLTADARLMDPETLPAETGAVQGALATLKSQVERGFALSSSIGWREDESFPGGNDLMEASIVGIGADPRTISESTAAVARAAVESGADREAFLNEIRAVVMGSDADTDERMSDNTDTDADDASDENRDEQSERDEEPPEWVQTVLENQETQTEILQSLADALREEDDDDDDDDEDEEENESDDDDDEDDDEENSAETEKQAAEVAELREAVDKLREGGVDVGDVDLPDPDEEQDADAENDSESADSYNKFGLKPQ